MDNHQISLSKKFFKYVLGSRVVVDLEDINFLQNHKKDILESAGDNRTIINSPNQSQSMTTSQHYQRIEKAINNNMIGSIALGGSLVLSLRRYFPNSMGVLSFGKMALDLSIMTAAFLAGLINTTYSTQESVAAIKKPMLLAYDPLYLKHMQNVNHLFGISYDEQVRFSLGNQEQANAWFQQYSRLTAN